MEVDDESSSQASEVARDLTSTFAAISDAHSDEEGCNSIILNEVC